LEALQSFSDAALTDCPQCNTSALQKLISAAGFQLKGGGWYVSDYKAKKASKKEEESAPACGQGACAACAPD
jgi:putative FmdB family regulatory protein